MEDASATCALLVWKLLMNESSCEEGRVLRDISAKEGGVLAVAS